MSQNEQYDPKVLRKLQLAELEVFKDFIKICDENGLSYFLFAGCAIGVERHKGFIPWDDDIDIGMLRDDYEKVLKIYREKYTDKYVVLDIDSQETFPFYNAEIARIGTKNIPYVFKDAKVPMGIDIALYPYDNVPDDAKKRRRQRSSVFFWSKLRILREFKKPVLFMHGWKRKVVSAMCIVMNRLLTWTHFSRKFINRRYMKSALKYNNENSSEFKAGDIGKYLTGFEVLNPELVICHLDSKSTMQIDITINKGRGYVPADENREYCTDVNVIPIDSIYTPIRNVKYQVENFRVEQKTDYEKLVLEITTDGSIHPKEALKEAAKILIYHFMLFSDEKITLETNDVDGNEEFDEEVLHMRQLLKTKLVDMDLSVRALNCLKAADVETLGDLVQFNKTDLLKFRNFGKKSLTELDDLLESLNLSFGTDISKYKLDKE